MTRSVIILANAGSKLSLTVQITPTIKSIHEYLFYLRTFSSVD